MAINSISEHKWDQIGKKFQGSPSTEIVELQKTYTSVLPEYTHHHPSWEFFQNNPNIGWKFHLDVSPENVRAVAQFLKSHSGSGFEHKYPSGGAIEDGKVFTVYTGSKENTEKAVATIFEQIGHLLQPPRVDPTQENGEVEFAPRIFGRFHADLVKDESGNILADFDSYGHDAISFLRGDSGQVRFGAKSINDATLAAKERALQVFGDYYGGDIVPHDPWQAMADKLNGKK